MHLHTTTRSVPRSLRQLAVISFLIASSATAQEGDTAKSGSPATPTPKEDEATRRSPTTTTTGAMVFVSPETGELVPVPAAGQMQRLLALGRSLATQRAAQLTDADGNGDRAPVLFQTPVGVGVRLDDRFLHSLRLHVGADGRNRWSCSIAEHDHSALGAGNGEPTAGGGTSSPEAPES